MITESKDLSKFASRAEAEEDLVNNFLRCEFDLDVPQELKDEASKFWIQSGRVSNSN